MVIRSFLIHIRADVFQNLAGQLSIVMKINKAVESDLITESQLQFSHKTDGKCWLYDYNLGLLFIA